MPVKKPKSPPKRGSKPKKVTPKKGASKPAAQKSKTKKKQAPPSLPPVRVSTVWDKLSVDRKLDVIGVGLALVGLLFLLSLISAQQSVLTGTLIRYLGSIFGWGIYILTGGLVVVGVWLVLRNLESIPTISIERMTGLVLLFLWLLTAMHALSAPPDQAEQVALNMDGGGLIGNVFVQILWNGLGPWGAVLAMIAWLLIGLALTLDVSIGELFKWMGPLMRQIRKLLARPAKTPESRPDRTHVPSNGYTPLQRTQVNIPASQENASQVGMPVTASSGPTIEWILPNVRDILDEGSAPEVNEEYVQQRARLIEDTLSSFGAPAQVIEISRGPTVTQFGVEPLFIETRSGRTRVRVNKISGLADDLALALSAPRIRIQAPVPGRGYVGIEVPNEEMVMVALRDILESELYQRKRSPLSFALGRDVAGLPQVAALDAMPHLLIAGTTGSGKSVCVNSILTSFLLNNTPDDLRLVLVDPKRVELTGYNGIPHLLAPVIVEVDRVVGALQWMTREMDKRYHTFAKIGARNINDYNARMLSRGGKKLPYLVIVIDELADLMMIAPDETERTITRLAQLARATGIHMILATQRPSVDVVTGLIKANFPARVAFAVASNTDSRVILDQPGAERLLGRGDMLYQAPEAPAPVRLQGVFVSDPEIQRLTEFWRAQVGDVSAYATAGGPVDAPLPSGVPLKQQALWEEMQQEEENDPLYKEAVDLVRREGRCSVSMLQRRMRIGYTRAARLVDMMEEKGIVSEPQGGSGIRDVLDYGPAAPPKDG